MTADEWGSALFDQHRKLLEESAVDPAVARERGYVSAEKKAELERRGFGASQRLVPGLVIPIWNVFGDQAGYQLRPDVPRVKDGKPLKYETPIGKKMVVDCHPRIVQHLGNPERPLLITEGCRKADAAISAGLDCVALLGVWNWRGTNDAGGKVALPDFEVVALNGRQVYIAFDSDVVLKPEVREAMRRLWSFLDARGANVAAVYLPPGDTGAKVGLDDFLAAGHTAADLLALAEPELRDAEPKKPPPAPWIPPDRRTLAEVDAAFTKWMETPDLEALHTVLAVVVANRCPGDPVWILIVAPPSAGKTELIVTVAALPDCHLAGQLSVPGLLSATSQREVADDATGGLLRVVGDRGTILNKDFGTILAMPRDQRAAVLQALRDIYDGHYDRTVGADGGRQITWTGHAGMIAGTTPAVDDHHAVIAALGDRYVMLRLDLADADRQAVVALVGVGDEEAMRRELTDAVAGFLGHLDVHDLPRLDDADRARVGRLGNLAARCRSTVVRDGYSRDIVNVHPPEQPARLAKQLGRILAGLRSIGVGEDEAWRITTRCSLDSIPATRRRVLQYLADTGRPCRSKAIAEALGLPTTTVRRAAEDLAAHGVVSRNDDLGDDDKPGGQGDLWSLTDWTRDRWTAVPEMSGDPDEVCVSDPVPEMSGDPDEVCVSPPDPVPEKSTDTGGVCASPTTHTHTQYVSEDFSGTLAREPVRRVFGDGIEDSE